MFSISMDLKYAIITLILVYSASFLEASEEDDFIPSYGMYCHGKACSPLKNDSKVLSYCQERGLTMDGRCCISDNGTSNVTIGIDLTDCNVTYLQAKMFAEFSNVEILMLLKNRIPRTKPKYFVGLTNLKKLYLPLPNGTCPGGKKTWDNIETDGKIVICTGQEDTCISHNLTCPARSNCTTAGPGSAYCFCVDGYYGYKCMRKGHFDTLTYCLSATAGITVLSVLLWLLQRTNKPKRSA